MERIEQGTRNLERLRKIATRQSGRVTFWNPNHLAHQSKDDTQTVTVYFDTARLVTQLYDKSKEEHKPILIDKIATASGFLKIVDWCWSNASYSTQ
jgi:hypothetical protein